MDREILYSLKFNYRAEKKGDHLKLNTGGQKSEE